MDCVAGVDGCRAGWIVALVEKRTTGTQFPRMRLCWRFEEVLELSPNPLVVDIPIGLLDEAQPGGRECDKLARRLLGRRRGSSVFSPPVRKFLGAARYEAVQGMSRQAFGILPKIREVDRRMTPETQHVVYEAHPELAFMSLVRRPMRFNKKQVQGRDERIRALERVPDGRFRGIKQIFETDLKAFTRKQVAPDDLLDAYVLAWTALRIAEGKAQRVPTSPPIDSRGLRMEIWY